MRHFEDIGRLTFVVQEEEESAKSGEKQTRCTCTSTNSPLCVAVWLFIILTMPACGATNMSSYTTRTDCQFPHIRHGGHLNHSRGLSRTGSENGHQYTSIEDVPREYIQRSTLSLRAHATGCANIYQSKENISSLRRCPQVHVIEFDNFRIPGTVLQTRCRCRFCQGPWGDGVCRPRVRQLTVLRVIGCDESGFYRYAHVLETVTQACRCVSYDEMARSIMEER